MKTIAKNNKEIQVINLAKNSFSDKHIEPILLGLSEFSNLQKISLGTNNFANFPEKSLRKMLQSNIELAKISLEKSIYPKSMQILFNEMRICKSLIRLNLLGNRIEDSTVQFLENNIHEMPNLTTLKIEIDSGKKILRKLIQKSKLKYLHLGLIVFNSETDCNEFIESVNKCKMLEKLKFDSISNENILLMILNLLYKFESLTHFEITGNLETSEKVYPLKALYESICKLQKISTLIINVFIKPPFVCAILEALKINRTIQNIKLFSSSPFLLSLSSIPEIFKLNNILENISVGPLIIGPEAGKDLTNSIKENKTIKCLELTVQDQFKNNLFQSLFTGLPKNNTISTIKISPHTTNLYNPKAHSKILYENMRRFYDTIRGNTIVTKLELKFCGICGTDCMELLGYIIGENTQLKHLDLSIFL